jgi:hypothetical protein
MTGSGLTQLIIPVAGTLFLAGWLAVVFYADRYLRNGRKTFCRVGGKRNLRVIFEVER